MIETLRNEKGESIIEALVSLLIIALGIMLIGSMIVSSGKMIDKSNKRLQNMYKVSNAMESSQSLKKLPENVTETGSEITIKIGNTTRIHHAISYESSNSIDVKEKGEKKKENMTLYSYKIND